MTNQERQDYQFYDQNQIKEEMQNQNHIHFYNLPYLIYYLLFESKYVN